MKKTYDIRCLKTQKTLYKGWFRSFRHCLEQAISEKISLKDADLRYRNLAGANLDDAVLQGADFTGSNLSGANMSESMLEDADFTNTGMVDACLSYSRLCGSIFDGARFGATDITGAHLQACTFSGLSAFSLDFVDTDGMELCRYRHNDAQTLPMNTPPRVLRGWLNTPVILLDHHVIIGRKSLCAASLHDFPLLASFFTPQKNIDIRKNAT